MWLRTNRALDQKVIALISALTLAGCGNLDHVSGPYPSDDALIKLFQENQETFNKLITSPDERSMASLGILHLRNKNYIVWMYNLFGPGACVKGYFHSKQPPQPLVDSIDQATTPCGPQQHELYRRINDDWYLYYSSNN